MRMQMSEEEREDQDAQSSNMLERINLYVRVLQLHLRAKNVSKGSKVAIKSLFKTMTQQ